MVSKFLVQVLRLMVICVTVASASYVDNYFEPDYIECYWCNSRDVYCGKRVTDTMVTTIKCPRHSKCTVYTNPYDNYYLHRGCSYGMDLGQIQVENGCFVEEEGSTYCFCDFNRCNAAGILDLRNLIDSGRYQATYQSPLPLITETSRLPNTTTTRKPKELIANQPLRLLKNIEIERDGYMELNRYPVEDENNQMLTTTTTPKTTTPTTPKPATFLPTSAYLSTMGLRLHNSTVGFSKNSTTSSRPTTTSAPFNLSTAFPFKTSYDPKLNNLDQLLIDYLNFSKSINSQIITESIRQQILKSLRGNEKLLKKFEQYTKENTNNPTNKHKYNEHDELLRLRNVTTTATAATTSATATSHKTPLLYKLNINDSYSKNLLDNIKSKENRLNIVIKKPAAENQPKLGQLVVDTNLNPNHKIFNHNKYINPTTQFPFNKLNPVIMPKVKPNHPEITTRNYGMNSTPTTTSSWLAKLHAKLSQSQSPFQFQHALPPTSPPTPPPPPSTQSPIQQPIVHKQHVVVSPSPYDWSHVLTQKYKSDLNSINFNCPRDGLFAHPHNCNLFLQCVDYGTLYKRFYVLNCPAGLYFNTKLDLCDYPDNVYCPN